MCDSKRTLEKCYINGNGSVGQAVYAIADEFDVSLDEADHDAVELLQQIDKYRCIAGALKWSVRGFPLQMAKNFSIVCTETRMWQGFPYQAVLRSPADAICAVFTVILTSLLPTSMLYEQSLAPKI